MRWVVWLWDGLALGLRGVPLVGARTQFSVLFVFIRAARTKLVDVTPTVSEVPCHGIWTLAMAPRVPG